jgi:hypothetical protein
MTLHGEAAEGTSVQPGAEPRRRRAAVVEGGLAGLEEPGRTRAAVVWLLRVRRQNSR